MSQAFSEPIAAAKYIPPFTPFVSCLPPRLSALCVAACLPSVYVSGTVRSILIGRVSNKGSREWELLLGNLGQFFPFSLKSTAVTLRNSPPNSCDRSLYAAAVVGRDISVVHLYLTLTQFLATSLYFGSTSGRLSKSNPENPPNFHSTRKARYVFGFRTSAVSCRLPLRHELLRELRFERPVDLYLCCCILLSLIDDIIQRASQFASAARR